MLLDSAGFLLREAEHDHEDPLFTEDDIRAAMQLWKTVGYHEPVDVGEGISVQFKDAGHILGSGMVEFSRGDKKLVFTGDLGNSPAPLLNDTEPVTGATYLVTESVYGDRNHEDLGMRKHMFEDVIEDTIKRGGALMIPSFSVERTQDLLYELNNLVEQKRIPDVPVFLDSPLAIRVTEVYKRYEDFFNKDARHAIQSGDQIFNFPRLKETFDSRDSREIRNVKNPKIIIAGSGMSTGGRILNHEQEYLGDPKSTLLIVGYQAPGTLGRLLSDGVRKVRIKNEEITVRARVEVIASYSAHKDSDALFAFVATGADTLSKVFVVLGEPGSSFYLAQRIRDNLGIAATVPKEGDAVTLDF
jgi:metallo-beta-lactamase family protein